MRRPLAAITVAAALWVAAPASALAFTDVTPAGSGIVLCPADLGGGALAWLRHRPASGARDRDTLDLAAAGLDPATAPKALVPGGGCPVTATAPSGASLVALNFTGLTNEEGEVLVLDRAADGTASKPVRLNRNERSSGVAAAMASSGAALVAWRESSDSDEGDDVTTLQVAAREAGGAFVRLGALDSEAGGTVLGVDDAGYGIAVWSKVLPSRGNASRLRVATRAPGGAFSAPRELGTAEDGDSTSLVVTPAGEALFAVSDESGVRIATGTARTGFAGLRRLATDMTEGVTTALSANGAAAVGWLTPPDENAPRGGVEVSDRLPGGDFGAPHPLAAFGTRLGGNDARKLRLAAAPDGRVVASWAVLVKAGNHVEVPVPVAALRRADGGWDAAVALAAPCREQLDAFGGFDAAGRPRVTFVDTALINGGDYGFPSDTRIRIARLDGVPATPVAPPKVTISANRRQVLRKDKLKLKIRCARACDATVFGVIGRYGGLSSGLFPAFARLSPGRWRNVTVEYASYFDSAHALQRGGRIAKVRLVVHACDSFGRLARARRTIGVRVPRTYG